MAELCRIGFQYLAGVSDSDGVALLECGRSDSSTSPCDGGIVGHCEKECATAVDVVDRQPLHGDGIAADLGPVRPAFPGMVTMRA